MSDLLRIENLWVTRSNKNVVRGVNLRVAGGEVVGLFGPSGCGKSTTMRAVTGVQANVQGDVTILGEPAGTRRARSRIGYVTQAPAIYPDITVVENLRFFAAVIGAGSDDVDVVLDQVDLADVGNQIVSTLSGGQRGRVSLATALLGSPHLLVLDEPTVGLDPVLRQNLWDTFDALAKTGVGILISSHVMDEASRCDRVALLRQGELLADDTPGELLARTGTSAVEDAFLAMVSDDES